MDSRIFPGLPRPEQHIIESVKAFLNIEKIKGRRGDVNGAKRLIVFLLQEFYPEWTLSEYGNKIGVDHATIIHYRKSYGNLYYGDSPVYQFMFLNMKAKINFWHNFTWDNMFEEIIERIPISIEDKVAATRMLREEFIQHKLKNFVVQCFCIYCTRKNVGGKEIQALLNVSMKANVRNYQIHNESLYLSAIDSVFRDKIAFLKSQEAEKKHQKRRA